MLGKMTDLRAEKGRQNIKISLNDSFKSAQMTNTNVYNDYAICSIRVIQPIVKLRGNGGTEFRITHYLGGRRSPTVFEYRSLCKVERGGTPFHNFSKMSCPGQGQKSFRLARKISGNEVKRRFTTSREYPVQDKGVEKLPTCKKNS